MSVVGIISEFNPFHSGHEFLLNQARLIAQMILSSLLCQATTFSVAKWPL